MFKLGDVAGDSVISSDDKNWGRHNDNNKASLVLRLTIMHMKASGE